VKASYGRKKKLRAIWLRQEDGGNPVETHAQAGTRYSFLQKLGTGQQCWRLRRVDGRDERRHAGCHARRLHASSCGLYSPVKARRQIGARISLDAGAFRGNTARPVNPVAQPANLELGRRDTGHPGANGWRPVHNSGTFQGPDSRAAAAGRMAAEFA